MRNSSTREYFLSFYEKNRFNFALALFFAVLVSTEGVVVSWLLGDILDAIAAANLRILGQRALLTSALVIYMFLIDTLFYRYRARFVHQGLLQYKALAYERISQKGISAFTRENTGRYLSALTNDAGSIEENYLNRCPLLLIQCLQFVFALAMMLLYSPLLTAVVIGLSLLPLLASLLMGKGLSVRERRVSDRNEGFTGQLKDLLSGFAVIKSFKAERQTQTLFNSANTALEHAKEAKRWYSGLLNAVSQTAGGLMQFGIFLIGAWLAIRGSITAGTVVIFVNLCNFLIRPIQTVPEFLASRKAAKGLVEKLAELTEEHTGHGGKAVPNKLTEGIELRDLSFSYGEDSPVLHDLRFRFAPGKCYAIVGPSGSGKSTLLSLLMGGFDSYRGSLTVDGQELCETDTDSLYDLMSLVGQNVFLFDDTIRRNITMFRDFPEAAVQSAIERAGLAPVIEQRGADYRCGENGVRLSGGERQRIAIARSLLRGADVLLVDEATSALDNETAQHISEAILDLHDLTRIVVTHRLDAPLLRRYDAILMLKNGVICEQGNFDELMARKGQFYSLYTVSNS